MSVEADIDSADPIDASAPDPVRYSRRVLILGLIGRAWIWFIIGCLGLSFLPVLFGWHSFIIRSGSMEPRIGVGDVVLTSPIPRHMDLTGHVIEFDAPGRPGEVLTHRVIGVDKAGLLITKGDANHTADSAHVERAHVHGLGRILVRYVGRPLVWAQTGQWLKFLTFLLSLGLAAIAIARDNDPLPQRDPAGSGPDGSGPAGSDDPATNPSPQGDQAADGAPPAAEAGPNVAMSRRRRSRPMWIARLLGVAIGTASLCIPSAYAAYSATTKNPGNSFYVPFYNYTNQVNSLGPYLYWKLDETSTTNTTAADSSGNGRAGVYGPSAGTADFTRLAAGALLDQSPNLAVQPVSASACVTTASATPLTGPTAFTEIIWFKAASGYTGGGKLIGFEKPQTGVGIAGSTGTYDRHIYMDGAGKIWFGVYNGGDQLIQSAKTYNDGAWHMAAATFGPAGMALYIDGASVGTNANTGAEASTGWFRVGCGNLSGWDDGWTGANPPPLATTTSNYVFKGGLDEATVFMSQLSASNIAFLWFIR